MPFSHIKAFLKKLPEDPKHPHSNDYITSTDTQGKRGLDTYDASLQTYQNMILLECILEQLQILNKHMEYITEEKITKEDL